MTMTPISQNIEQDLIAMTNQLLAQSGEPYKRDIQLSASLRGLGIDSLSRAELFQRVEKHFAVSVPDRLLAEVETLNDIAKFLHEAKPGIRKVPQQNRIISHGDTSPLDLSKIKTLTDILLLYGETTPDRPHIYFQNENGQEEIITYGQLLKSALRVACGLRERGLKEGETVAIMQPTHPGFFYTFFGTLLAGGVPVPIYPPFRMHMLEAYAKTEARILHSAGVRILVTFDQAEKLSLLLQAFVPSLKHVTTVQELMEPKELSTLFQAKSDSFAFIQYTSGSTADPKGVLLTHYNLISNIQAYGKAVEVKPTDVAVSWLPLYHDMGLIGMWLGSLYHGIPLVLMTPFSFLNHPERWLWAVHYHRGTLSGAPNFAYELCIRKIDPGVLEGLDLSSWRVAVNGAEKVYPRTLEQFTQKFAPYGFKRSTLMPVYGLAESAVALTMPPLGREFRLDYVDRKQFEEDRRAIPATGDNTLTFVACGYPLDKHEIRIVDDENKLLEDRTVGNLQFRGPSSMQGYYNNPRATQAIYHDGWLATGDLAYQADGELFITGRRKDLIIKAGRNLYPAEIEELVGAVPGIRQGCVAAFGVTEDERATEQLVVVAETREKNKAMREQIISNIKEAIAATLDIAPDVVILTAPRTVPKTSSGKLQRAACKKMYLAGRLRKLQMPPWIQVAKLSTHGMGRKLMAGLWVAAKCVYTLYVVAMTLMTLLPVYFIVRYAKQKTAAKVCKYWAKLILNLALCPVNIIHEQKLKQDLPVIFTLNHASYIDAIVALSIVPANTRLVGKKELLNTPILRTFMRQLNYLAVDRTDLPKGLEDTKLMEQSLKEGHSILIFPEGTFGYSSGLRPFRLGAFKIATETNVPIRPIALRGTRHILRDEEKLMWPGKIVVTVCELIKPVGTEWQDITQLRNEVRAKIAKYCGEPSLDFIAAQVVAPKKTG
jgi:fatty-acyl-CoA synthase